MPNLRQNQPRAMYTAKSPLAGPKRVRSKCRISYVSYYISLYNNWSDPYTDALHTKQSIQGHWTNKLWTFCVWLCGLHSCDLNSRIASAHVNVRHDFLFGVVHLIWAWVNAYENDTLLCGSGSLLQHTSMAIWLWLRWTRFVRSSDSRKTHKWMDLLIVWP